MADGDLALLDSVRHLAPGTTGPRPVAAGHGPGPAGGLSCTTAVMTLQGLRPAGRLAPGDRVLTRDRGFRPLRGVIAASVSAASVPTGTAVRIPAGAFGRGLPQGDLLVAPDQCLMVRCAEASLRFGTPEVLVAAGDLVGRAGIGRTDAAACVHLVALTFDRHELIWAEGAWCASEAPADGTRLVRPALHGCAPHTRVFA